MPIIVGAPRSGTTLLRLMLDSHPELSIPPETGFLAPLSALDQAVSSDELRRRVFDTITRFPPDAPTWPDFGVAPGELESALGALEPVTVAEGA
ncbi:MAG: sulfotransferase, partial [Thermoanaerobaculia bacterium]